MYDCVECGQPRHGGLFFGAGIGDAQWRCLRCQSPSHRNLITDLDNRARDILRRDTDGVHWPYGPNIYVQMRADLLDWADQHKLRSGDTRCSSGLHWLDKGRCAKRDCHSKPDFYDHTTMWLSRNTGRPALVFTQPYRSVDPAEIDQAISDHPYLTAEISPESWYGGGTTGVYIWNDNNR
ncbi:hypothetical protein [Streptomyces sp. NPDC004435]|uniref:hypothetical protein n=1 Tax=Streptomyces sp. NPDC004435 TaxID=3364701 RepID=UPI003673F924